MKAARQRSCTWWALSAAQDKKRKDTAGAPSEGRRVRPREPSRWSRRRSAQPKLVYVHPCCGLQPERLSPDPPAQGRTMCSLQKSQGSLDFGESVQGEAASEREGQLVDCRQARQQQGVTKQKHRSVVGVVLVVIGRGVIAGEHGEPSEVLTLNFPPHRMFGVASVTPAVLVAFAPPFHSGARGTTSTCRPGGRRNGISSHGAARAAPAALRGSRIGGGWRPSGREGRSRRTDQWANVD